MWEHHWLLGPFLRAANAIFIQRGEVYRRALDAAVAWLRSGRIFGIAPEGTRSPAHQLTRGKPGIIYIAQQSGAAIVPIACVNTEDALPALLRLRRKHVLLCIGEPFRLPPIDPARRTEATRQQTDEVMCRIALLLPERYHGAYATTRACRRSQRLPGSWRATKPLLPWLPMTVPAPRACPWAFWHAAVEPLKEHSSNPSAAGV
jgi:1-acyl-sn-glycerol-3-phosphate acyltransferase